jgi:hypothetical protein
METSSDTTSDKSLRIAFKKDNFDHQLRVLIDKLIEVVNIKYAVNIDNDEVRPEIVSINRYLNLYNQMQPEEHFAFFELVYNRNRNDILNTLQVFKDINNKIMQSEDIIGMPSFLSKQFWLCTKNINIQFGDGVKNFAEKYRNIRLPLSTIYNMALSLQEAAEKIMQDIDKDFISPNIAQDIIRPNILLLHLMRIFYYLNDGIDRTPLGEIVTYLEVELGTKGRTVGSEPWLHKRNTLSNADPNSGIASIFNFGFNIMRQFGLDPPKDITIPTEADLKNTLDTVLSNDITKNAMQNITKAISPMVNGQNSTGEIPSDKISEMFTTVINNIAKPETLSAIQQSLTQTANIAKDAALNGGKTDNNTESSESSASTESTDVDLAQSTTNLQITTGADKEEIPSTLANNSESE